MFFLVFVWHSVHAQNFGAPVQCADVPNSVCKFFASQSDKMTFDFPDGTYVQNPFYAPPVVSGPMSTEATPVPPFADIEVLGPLMKKIDVPGISMRAKLKLGVEGGNLFDKDLAQVSVPWPLADENAKIQLVDRQKVIASLEKTLGEAQFQDFKAFCEKHQKAIDDEATHLQARQQSELLAQHKLDAKFSDPVAMKSRQDQVLKIFREAKATVESVIRAGETDPSKFTDEQRNLLIRIEKFNINFISLEEGEKKSFCRGRNANMSNFPGQASISICPASVWRPDLALITVFGHEIMHSIDPCAMQNDFATIDKEKAKAFLENQKLVGGQELDNLREVLVDNGNTYAPPSWNNIPVQKVRFVVCARHMRSKFLRRGWRDGRNFMIRPTNVWRAPINFVSPRPRADHE